MLRRRSTLLGGSLLLITILAAFTLFRNREPQYQGRSLSSWISGVNGSGLVITPQTFVTKNAVIEAQAATIEAVRSMGPDAFPFLIQWLNAKDGPIRQRFLNALGPWRCYQFGILTAGEKQSKARLTLSRLGTNAAVAWKQILLDPNSDLGLRLSATAWCQTLPEDAPQIIPVALRMMADLKPEDRESIRWAIGRFGPDAALPILVRHLQDPDRKIQLMAMRAIKFFNHQGRPATAALVQQLKSSDAEIGLGAADTLLGLDPHNIPALVYRIHHGELSKRTTGYWILTREEPAAEGLSTYGTNAQPALSALTNLLNDSKRYVRLAASNAITSIVTQQ